MAEYAKTSPYYGTDSWGKFLDVMVDRKISPKRTDVLYKIDKIYENRPDLLAHDLYGNSALWWVFVQRNPDVLKDPIGDFKAGKSIFIPAKTQLTTDLGL